MGQLLRNWASAFLVPRPLVGAFYLHEYIRDWRRYQGMASTVKLQWRDSYPCLVDRVAATPFDPHYFYQGAWLARRLSESKPDLHVDIGSSALTMSVVSATSPTVFLDFRPLKADLKQFTSIAGSVLQLPFATASIRSLSCLHVIEHIGLGRYGDPLDPSGSVRAAHELLRVLAPGGRLYLSLPVGRERVCFNAHRVFSPSTVKAWFQDLALVQFGLVDDDGRFTESSQIESGDALEYGCGLFDFTRA